jgi:hypothetical protein
MICFVSVKLKLSSAAVVEGAEDPERILDQAVSDMNNDLIKLRQATAKVYLKPIIFASMRALEDSGITLSSTAGM